MKKQYSILTIFLFALGLITLACSKGAGPEHEIFSVDPLQLSEGGKVEVVADCNAEDDCYVYLGDRRLERITYHQLTEPLEALTKPPSGQPLTEPVPDARPVSKPKQVVDPNIVPTGPFKKPILPFGAPAQLEPVAQPSETEVEEPTQGYVIQALVGQNMVQLCLPENLRVNNGCAYPLIVADAFGGESYPVEVVVFSGAIPQLPCLSNSDCAGTAVCTDGVCMQIEPVTDTCTTNTQCNTSQKCVQGSCVAVSIQTACATGADCGNGQICDNGQCQLEIACITSQDCPAGKICIEMEATGLCVGQQI